MTRQIVTFLLMLTTNSYAISFKGAVTALSRHESVDSILGQSRAVTQDSKLKGSWGDPKFKIAAKNYPIATLKRDQSPMTGVEFGISQKIPLTNKYGKFEDAFKSLAKSYEFDAKDKKEALTKALWEILIIKKKISEELIILHENNSWIIKNLKVSKKLYENGQASQQAILDIQIRKSEIENEINNKDFELSQVNDNLFFLIGSSVIDEKSIPWGTLNKRSINKQDNKDLSLREKIKARHFRLTASRLNYIPDVTVSFGITKRSNIDDKGDFVGAQITIPIPSSEKRYSGHAKSVQEKYVAVKKHEYYKKIKRRDVSIAKKEILKLNKELSILRSRTLKYARNSRSITTTSYGLGNANYIELLQSEFKLQKILMHIVLLESKAKIKKVGLKYLLGEPLNE